MTLTTKTGIRTAGAAAASALTVALLAGCTAPAAPQPEPTTGTAAEVAPEVAEALDEVLAAGAVAVTVDVRDGEKVTEAAAGLADLEDERPAEAGDPVRIASITKTVLAVVVLQLVEEGALSLDTTVDEILPGLLSSAPADVTVAQLLAHRSGLPDYIPALVPDAGAGIDGADDVYEPEDLVAIAQQQPWLAEPGGAFHYSNAGYTVLGLMVEKVSGETVPALMAARVFEPTGMDATSYPDDATIPAEALRGYMTVDEELIDMTDYEPSFWSFGASLISTVGDVSAFNAALQGGELLQEETLAQMRAIGAEGYGLGVLAAGDACGVQPPEFVFGQRGNGFGYNSLTLASVDGQRVVTVAYTGGSFDPASDPIFPAMNEVLVAGLASTCP